MTRHFNTPAIRKTSRSSLRKGLMIAVAIVTCSVFPMSAATAQDDPSPQLRQFSAQAGEAVNSALELAKDGNLQSALNSLQATLSRGDLIPYERSTIYQMIGQYAYELDRTTEAQAAFEGAVSAGGLLPKEAENMRVVIAQLMIGNGQYRAGAERLENYLNSGGASKSQYIELLVNAWIQAEDYPRALPWAQKWFDAATPKKREHFDLLNFLFNTLGMQREQADLVKEMINRWPDDKGLWDVWASMLANGGREDEAFEVKKIMYLKGLLTTETDLLKVVQYYSFYDMPYQAAEILEAEMAADRIARTPTTLKQLSDLFRQAREYKRAIPVLEAAALQSGDRKTYAALGEALYNSGECEKSEAAFSEAIHRGYDAGKSWMLIASCRYDQSIKLDRLNCDMSAQEMAEAPITRARNAALEAFENVPKRSSEHQGAQTWIQFIETEKHGVQRRCDVIVDVERDVCFQIIKRAFDGKFITGEIQLDDPSCQKYLDEYKAEYRPVELAE